MGTAIRFEDAALAAGLPMKAMYTVAEVSKASGVPMRALYENIHAGRLGNFVPPGRERGTLIAPEWFDEWASGGIR